MSKKLETLKTLAMVDVAYELLKESDKPLAIQDLFKEIAEIRTKHIDWRVLKEYQKKPKNYYVELKNTLIKQVEFKSNVNINKTLKSIALIESYVSLNERDERIIPYLKTLKELLNIHDGDLSNYMRTEALKKAKEKVVLLIDKEIKKDQSNETKIKQFESESIRSRDCNR